MKTPADMAGVKLRMPGSETWQFLGKALGANPTPMAFEEVYLAMQTGTVDGLENPLPDAEAAKFYEVSKQVVLTGHMVSNTFFAVAKTFWDGLSADQKAAIEAAEAKAKAFNDEGVLKTEADAKGFFEGKGVKVTTPGCRGLPHPGPEDVLGVRNSPPTGPRACWSASTRRGCRRAGDRLSESLRLCCCLLD